MLTAVGLVKPRRRTWARVQISSAELGSSRSCDGFFELAVLESAGVHCGALCTDLFSRLDMPNTPSIADSLKCVLASVIDDSDPAK
jgi:hypothetical protein